MELRLKKIRLAIVGAGELGLQAMHYATLCNPQYGTYEVTGFIDDTKCCSDTVYGLPVIGKIEDIELLYAEKKFDAVFVAIGYKHLEFKKRLVDRLAQSIPLANIVAPSVYVDKTAHLGRNVMLYPGCIIDKDVVLSDGALLNLGCVVSHNSVVGHSCFLAPRVTVAGFSTIGECPFLGAATVVIDNISICQGVYTGAGATIVKDIVSPGQYIGSPAVKFK